MKRMLALLLACLLLGGCANATVTNVTAPSTAATAPEEAALLALTAPDADDAIEYVSRFSGETAVILSDEGITVDGGPETDAVFTSRDIIYYEDRESYESGNAYGEGEAHERHTAQEAAAHLVVNITKPGAYRVSGSLSAGQLRIDLGESAYDDPDAVVELILEDASITCTVAPAILFLSTYECDGAWSADTAKPEVDTSAAGANLILVGSNTVTGSHVAKVYQDAEGEKKLWKQDGAIYSYRSLNVFGPGSLLLTADNEGLDTELHLTVNGGDITVRSDNDGINTNEDGVSVTTVNGGSLQIHAGLGAEGDGIDSNGYLVINGGVILATANPAGDAGLDSDLGSYIHGGTVLALGSTMDWAESDSGQVTMNLQFAGQQTGGLTITTEELQVLFAYLPGSDSRSYSGAILSSPNLPLGGSCLVYSGGTLEGASGTGIQDVTAVTGFSGGTMLSYTGTDVGMGFGGQGGMPELPAGEMPEMPEGERPALPEGETFPEDFDPGQHRGPGGGQQRPEGSEPPEGSPFPDGKGGRDFGSRDAAAEGESSTRFFLGDRVNCFSGITSGA